MRLIRKWLTAGVVENGQKTDVRVGTPQGAVISPLLANIYLHYVFDLWTHQWRGRHARGDVMIVQSRSNGWFQLKRLTSAKRMGARLKAIRQALARRMHEPIPQVGRWLRRAVQGYFNYHGVPGNADRLDAFRKDVSQRFASGLKAGAVCGSAARTDLCGAGSNPRPYRDPSRCDYAAGRPINTTV